MLEQLLTTADLELTSGAIQETRMQIQQNLQKKLEDERRQLEEERAKLAQMNAPQEAIPEGYDRTLPGGGPTPEALQEINSDLNSIFDESDRMQ